jgi:Ca2+-binding RTX toxin-like protein
MMKYQRSGAATAVGGVYDLSASANAKSLIDNDLLLQSTVSADTVITAGADYVNTGSGNDTVRIKDLTFRSLDGGQGYDRLVLDSSFSGASSIVLADFVSNARGNGGDSTANVRVNAAGYHKLLGFEQVDLSGSTAAQSIAVAADDVNQLSESNTLGVVLGANDSISVSGFTRSAPTWGYYSFNGVIYDQRWTATHGADTYTLYAKGGALPSFSEVAGATAGNDTLSGTSGNDLLQGDQGNDTLTGQAGADIFRFIKDELGTDIITDFNKSQGDKLDLSQLLGGTGLDGSRVSSVSQYLQLSQAGTGDDAVLKVDVDGLGDFAAGSEMTINLTGAWVSGNLSDDTLTKLIDDRVIAVNAASVL